MKRAVEETSEQLITEQPRVAGLQDQQNGRPILILGHGLQEPWTEGTRVLGRDISQAIGLRHPVHIVSLTGEILRSSVQERLPVEHVYTPIDWMTYGAVADYAALPRFIRYVRRVLAASGSQVVHLIGLPLPVVPWLRGRRARIVTHVTFSDRMYMGRIERLQAALAWRLFDRWIDAYACTSERVYRDLMQQGYNPRKLHIVPPPIDVHRFQPLERGAAREALGLPANAFVVAYIGGVAPLRFPVGEVMKALKLAHRQIPEMILEIFTVRANEAVLAATNDPDLPVHLHLDPLTEDQKAMVYSAADVVLFPYSVPIAPPQRTALGVEPPLTLLEAMACQAIVALGPYANHSRVVEHGSNGLTYTTAEELGSHLRDLYALGPEQRTALGRRARADIVRGYSFTVAVHAIESVWAAIGLQEA